MDKITPSDLDDRRSNDETPFLLDIRPAESFKSENIDGSYNVPVYTDLQRGDESTFRNSLDEIPTNEEIVVVCKAGIVAKKATGILNAEGYDAATLLGGMSGWKGYHNNSISYRLRSLIWRVLA